MSVILITGGARSGKSRFAQELASKPGEPVLFVATAEPGDEEMCRRIEKHRKNRPPGWRTLEAATGTGRQIQQNAGNTRTIIVDCITLLVSNILQQYTDAASEKVDEPAAEKAVIAEINGLIDTTRLVTANFIIVTNEVGMGLVPPNQIGRLYRDLLGKANQMLAQNSAEVYLMVAGIPLLIKPAVQ